MTALSDRIAVTGVGIVSALGVSALETFERAVRGERAIAALSRFDTKGARVHLAAEVPAAFFAAGKHLDSGLGLSPGDRLGLAAAREALASARCSDSGARFGLSVGGTTGGMAYAEDEVFAAGAREAGPSRARRLLSHPLSATARVLDAALGPFVRSSTVCTACSSGAVAIVEGAHFLLSDQVDYVVAGGVDALCRMTFGGFDALGALDPEPCRPFDRARQGLTLGEGAAFVVLERGSQAEARGARVLAWLSGFAIGSEAHHVTHPDPSGRRPIELMRKALAMAGLGPERIDYVNAHGTGTRANDAMEARALLEVFGPEASRVRVSSSKGQLGHTLGAAGALEAALTALALDRQIAPPTGGLEEPEVPGLRHVIGRGEPAELRAALSSSFGFGGMNAVLLLERYSPSLPLTPRTSCVISAAISLGVGLEHSGRAVVATATETDPLSRLEPERSRRFDRAAAWVTASVQETLSRAGLAGARAGLSVGSAYGTVERSLAFLERMRDLGLRMVPPAEFPQLVQSALAGNASIYLTLEGPVAGVSAGSESAPSALARAVSWVELDQADVVVAGALEATDPVVSGLLGPRRKGEGGGFLLVERESHALERGRAPLARLAFHVEERSDQIANWPAPRSDDAVVVLAGNDGLLARIVRASTWSSARCLDLGVCGVCHEALSGSALALGAELVLGGTKEVLIVAGGKETRFVTRLEAMGNAA